MLSPTLTLVLTISSYLLLLIVIKPCVALREISCIDPDVISPYSNHDRKFLIIGSEGSEGAGLGNLLIFFPSAFWFASFTNRNIIIDDNSIIGQMCKVITCGFPFVSEIKSAFPQYFVNDALKHVQDVKHSDFMRYIEGSHNVSSSIVRAWGYKAASDWWVYFNSTVQCVKKITGCDLGDIPCGDRHAFQRLIRGPFKSQLTTKEEERIYGVPQHIKHAILTLPHAYAPRLDAAIHLRCQFAHFEQQSDINNKEYQMEVQTWLNSTESAMIFNELEDKLLHHINMTRIKNEAKHLVNEPIYVYLAGDNEQVKDAFIASLEQKHDYHLDIKVMRVETSSIHHVKNLEKMIKLSNGEGLLDLVFDWYALTLANVVFAWRKDGTNMLSTFVHSAQRVSGTTERTDIDNPESNGIGTKGYQLIKNKHGYYHWDAMWVYTFLEDFII